MSVVGTVGRFAKTEGAKTKAVSRVHVTVLRVAVQEPQRGVVETFSRRLFRLHAIVTPCEDAGNLSMRSRVCLSYSVSLLPGNQGNRQISQATRSPLDGGFKFRPV